MAPVELEYGSPQSAPEIPATNAPTGRPSSAPARPPATALLRGSLHPFARRHDDARAISADHYPFTQRVGLSTRTRSPAAIARPPSAARSVVGTARTTVRSQTTDRHRKGSPPSAQARASGRAVALGDAKAPPRFFQGRRRTCGNSVSEVSVLRLFKRILRGSEALLRGRPDRGHPADVRSA